LKGGVLVTIEQLAKQIFDKCAKDGEAVSMDEAMEMAEMEQNSKKNCKTYAKAEKKSENKPKNKPKKPKTVKVSAEKAELFNLLWEGLNNYYQNAEILTNNKLISVQINEKTFKIDIIETRPKKS
jgi:putative protein kinase ArgK-like GTPase of G3E family